MQQGKRSIAQGLVPFLAALMVVLFLSVVQALGLEMPQTLIEHAGVASLVQGQTIPVQAMVTDPLGIFTVRCYFRFRRDADFVFIDLEPKGDGRYQGTLPAPGETVQEMEYLYLAVNERRQVVRTPVYTVKDQKQLPRTLQGGDERVMVRGDLALPPDAGSLMLNTEQLKVAAVAAAERFGMTAGLYNASLQNAGAGIAQGYFGAYELQPDGKYIPLKGAISLQEKVSGRAGSRTVPFRSAEALPPSEIIGPDIAGDTWEGICYFGWGESMGAWFKEYETPVTAIVTHIGNAVTITLSTECEIFNNVTYENVGQYFQGTMDWGGNMLLTDQRDPVQTWSSHWGPVTESSIMMGDYVTPFDPENNPYPDYYVIELTREYPPPPPPPPPPNYSFLPAVYHLLLKSP